MRAVAVRTADGPAIHKYLKKKLHKSQLPPVPQVWVAGTYLGGVDGTRPVCLPHTQPSAAGMTVRVCGACGVRRAAAWRPQRPCAWGRTRRVWAVAELAVVELSPELSPLGLRALWAVTELSTLLTSLHLCDLRVRSLRREARAEGRQNTTEMRAAMNSGKLAKLLGEAEAPVKDPRTRSKDWHDEL